MRLTIFTTISGEFLSLRVGGKQRPPALALGERLVSPEMDDLITPISV